MGVEVARRGGVKVWKSGGVVDMIVPVWAREWREDGERVVVVAFWHGVWTCCGSSEDFRVMGMGKGDGKRGGWGLFFFFNDEMTQ